MTKKSVYISIASMLVMVLLFYFFVFSYVVPNAAKISIPYAWRTIPLMQDSSVAHAYFGEASSTQKTNGLTESWQKGTKDQKYTLSVHYSETSQLAVSYKIEYHFKKWLIQKEYVLVEKDNRQ
jgi:hypothetical protein